MYIMKLNVILYSYLYLYTKITYACSFKCKYLDIGLIKSKLLHILLLDISIIPVSFVVLFSVAI